MLDTLISHLLKSLQQLSKTEANKNFVKRGEVDVIIFTHSITNPPHFEWIFETITTLPLTKGLVLRIARTSPMLNRTSLNHYQDHYQFASFNRDSFQNGLKMIIKNMKLTFIEKLWFLLIR